MIKKLEEENDNYLTISGKCNLNCVFCSAKDTNAKQTDDEIMACISNAKGDELQVGGWEPTLSKDLVFWIKRAKKGGVKTVILRTNAVLLAQNKKLIQKLVDAGVDQFNVNFPSNIPKLCDFITQTKGSYDDKYRALNNLIAVAGGDKVRVTFVINSLNYTTILNYVKFMTREFPSISFIGFNMVHVEGHVENRKYLVPKLSDVRPYLAKAAAFCQKKGSNVIIDDIPLCFMSGFEDFAIYTWTLPRGDESYLPHTKHHQSCKICRLSSICPGLDNAYFKIHGAKELKASKKSDKQVLKEIEGRRLLRQKQKPKATKLRRGGAASMSGENISIG